MSLVDPVAAAASAAPVAPAEGPAVRCPMCEYDLRGLIEPRCPECGYRFDWAELTDPTKRRHPYLFEHHPERNAWSFVRTLVGGLRPRRFWTILYPTQPSRPRRLWLYFVLVALTSLTVAAALIGQEVEQYYAGVARQRAMAVAMMGRSNRQALAWRQSYPRLTPQQIADRLLPYPSLRFVIGQLAQWGLAVQAVWLPMAPVVWVVLTAATMMIFRFSMRRARVRPIHALRCVLYSGDVIVWANVLLLLEMAGTTCLLWQRSNNQGIASVDAPLWAAVLLAGWAVFVYRFGVALKKYLRFDHAVLTVVATQVIVALAVLVIISNLDRVRF